MIEAPSGRIYGFGRDKGKVPATLSFDKGISWAKGDRPPIKAPKCQKNAIVVGNRVLISHPSGKDRSHGVISVGEFYYDKRDRFRGVKWTENEIKINDTFFAYSCMAKIDDNTVGLLYENKPSGEIAFKKIKL